MLSLDIQLFEWNRINIKGSLKMEPFTQANCCSVQLNTKKSDKNNNHTSSQEELKRASDQILEGLYFFGGKNAKGQL